MATVGTSLNADSQHGQVATSGLPQVCGRRRSLSNSRWEPEGTGGCTDAATLIRIWSN